MSASTDAGAPVALPKPFAVGALVTVRFAHILANVSSMSGTLAAVDALGVQLTDTHSSSGTRHASIFIPWHAVGYLEPAS